MEPWSPTYDSPIRIQNESNMPHPSLARPFLKWDTELLEAFARFIDVVHRNSNMPKTFPRVRVSTGISLEIGVRLRTVVVRQLQDTCEFMKTMYGSWSEIGTFATKSSRSLFIQRQFASFVIVGQEVEGEIAEFML